MPIPPELEHELTKLGAPPSTLIEKFIHGSGSGGQKINKTASCVYLKHEPTGLDVKYQSDRSREQNRLLARQELIKKLRAHYQRAADAKKDAREKKRRTHRPRSRNSKNRMLKNKKYNAHKKRLRKKPGLDD